MDRFKEENENIGFIEGFKMIKNYFTHKFLQKLHQPITYEDYLKILNLDWILKG